jgi:hypothetical protein
MRSSALDSLFLRRALAVDFAISAFAAVGLWIVALAQAWPRLIAQGVICGSDPVFLGHCPACAPALAATALAAGFGLALLAANRKV